MKDFVIKGNGNSRYLKSSLEGITTWEQFRAALAAGTLPIDLNGINPEGFQQLGDPLNKATLLKDDTAEKYGLGDNAVVDDAFKFLAPGKLATITVTTNPGATVTCTDGSLVLTKTAEERTCVFHVKLGTWTIKARLGEDESEENVVVVSTFGNYTVSAPAVEKIYGVQWDGTSTTVWSRTDDAASFVNPTPYRAGATSYGSPFDNLYPWSGMVRVTDAVAGNLVAIPKFWYKWTKSGNSLKLQIADVAVDGFHTSPAHADRGDGNGERDYVYVGRYHCASNYKSTSGVKPVGNITRAAARGSIHALGSDVWQYDFAMYWTIMMLYLVEYADWNSQAKIGYGCGNNSGTENMGATDAMPYHTGTTANSLTTYAAGIQYRHIEGLWSNVIDWCDGIYFSGANVYCIKNPASFSDTSGGTTIGTRPTSSNWISAWSIPRVSGFEYALYPSAVAGSENTYVCDYYGYSASGVVLYVGGPYSQSQVFGAFYLSGNFAASDTGANTGCRLMKLPDKEVAA